ncbi:MAG TPA: PBP1A family penicillin-binding protein [Patescibacteria group bacterium]
MKSLTLKPAHGIQPVSQKEPRSKFFYLKQIIFGFADAALALVMLVLAGFAWLYYSATPAASQLVDRKIAQTTIFYDRTGQHELYELHGEENRKILTHDQIPDTMRVATIATEDANFYHHIGIDPLSIARAIKVNLASNDIRQGGSTITQQLARNAFLTRDRTLKRKVLEAVFAIKIERHYSKDEILDQYLNEVPYGANAYGVEAAAETFFGKQASDLTLDEAAFLAALPKAPSYYSPYGSNSDALEARQKYILDRIGQLQLAPHDDVQQALATDTLSKVKPISQPIVAPHFVFYVLDQLERKYGKDLVETGGLRIYTTLDLNMQKIGEDAVSNGVRRGLAYGASNAGLVAMNPQNGDILAMVGSRNYYDKAIDGQVNVTISPRQPGSSFKPFAYAQAFVEGYQPETMILDARTDFGPGGPGGRDYIPRNYDGRFHGLLPMRSTLAQSLNIPAVKVLYLAGIDDVINLAHRMGITTLNDRKRYGLSLVLGGGEVKLLDMANAYSVFANEGMRTPVQYAVKILDSKGNLVQQDNLASQRVLDVQIARKINSILSDNKARTSIFGAHSPLILDGKTVAAKTGTTSEFRDAWTMGYTPSLTVGVWAGNNDNRRMREGADGVFVAAPIWHDFMTRALTNQPNETFVAYDKAPVQTVSSSPQMRQVITYYNNKTGKKISEEKAKKTDPEKVDKHVDWVPVDGSNTPAASSDSLGKFSIALPVPTDPMYKRWVGQLNDYQDNNNPDNTSTN